MIVSDSREPENDFPREELDCGDYVIFCEDKCILVERKTYQDLVSSYRKGRLHHQLRMCFEQDCRTILLIEGSRGAAIKYANSSYAEIRRMLTALTIRNPELQMIYSSSYDETKRMIGDFEDWVGDSGKANIPIRETEKVPPSERPRFIVEGFPGVGPGKAQLLLDHFGSVTAIVTASADDLQEVDGIGPATAKKILDAVK